MNIYEYITLIYVQYCTITVHQNVHLQINWSIICELRMLSTVNLIGQFGFSFFRNGKATWNRRYRFQTKQHSHTVWFENRGPQAYITNAIFLDNTLATLSHGSSSHGDIYVYWYCIILMPPGRNSWYIEWMNKHTFCGCYARTLAIQYSY